jgi:PRTRC genetic system protein C
MSLTANPVRRLFLYSGRMLADPDPSLTPEQVKAFFSNIYPDLANAVIQEARFEGETQTYEFQRAMGTKG